MAAGILPAPGSQYGPCLEHCRHNDCAETRRMAATACVLCGKAIGFDARFHNHRGDEVVAQSGLVHASCLEATL